MPAFRIHAFTQQCRLASVAQLLQNTLLADESHPSSSHRQQPVLWRAKRIVRQMHVYWIRSSVVVSCRDNGMFSTCSDHKDYSIPYKITCCWQCWRFFWLSARSRSLTTVSTVLFFTLICPQLPLQRSLVLPIRQIVEELYSFPSSCWSSLHSSFNTKALVKKFWSDYRLQDSHAAFPTHLFMKVLTRFFSFFQRLLCSLCSYY